MGVVYVSLKPYEHVSVVAPKGDVRDVVAPAKCDFVGWPIGIPIPRAAEEVA